MASDGRARAVPAIVARAGPFDVIGVPLSVGGRSALPFRKRRGIFVAPIGSEAQAIGVRQHEYGHLALESSGLIRASILHYLLRNGISEFWAQAGLDCIVNGFMLGVNCAEISSLKPCEFPLPTGAQRFLLATIYLRCVLLDCAEEYRPALIYEGGFDAVEIAVLDDIGNRLAARGRDRVRTPGPYLLDELGTLQAIFGPHYSTRTEDVEESERSDQIDPVLKAGLASTFTRKRAEWGELEHVVISHTKLHRPARSTLRRRPGFMGPLRFPHRAILGGDGQAFSEISRAAGGTALIDCSGSMSLNEDMVRRLMSKLPAIEIALYSGFPANASKGWLCVIARSGRLGDISGLSPKFGGYNVIDGPALVWLGNRRAPRWWISDGAVNGRDGVQSRSLYLEAINLVRQFRIQRMDTAMALLESRKSRTGSV